MPGRRGVAATVVALAAAASLLAAAGSAQAAIVPTVQLATSASYSVLAGSTVTNTGPSVLNNSAGLSPGTAIDGFPPGIVLPPAIIDATSPAAAQAQLDLTAAYIDAAGRPLNAETTADLSGLTLVGGVYAAASKAPLTLNGTLVLDGQGDPNSVFIFQTDSSLITGSASSVQMINGAQECNVFWQVGSSATLGTGSVFVGNILALTSISVTTGVTVHGRALARNGAVTLDTDVFAAPTCDLTSAVTTTTVDASATTAPGATAPGDTAPGDTAPGDTVPGDTTPGGGTNPGGGTTPISGTIPRTGTQAQATLMLAAFALVFGVSATFLARRRPLGRSTGS